MTRGLTLDFSEKITPILLLSSLQISSSFLPSFPGQQWTRLQVHLFLLYTPLADLASRFLGRVFADLRARKKCTACYICFFARWCSGAKPERFRSCRAQSHLNMRQNPCIPSDTYRDCMSMSRWTIKSNTCIFLPSQTHLTASRRWEVKSALPARSQAISQVKAESGRKILRSTQAHSQIGEAGRRLLFLSLPSHEGRR